MKKYADCPQILRDFLAYHENIKNQSPKTIGEYYLDLRMFLRFIRLMRSDMPITTELDTIPIKGIDIEFIKTITTSEIFDFLSYLANDRTANPDGHKKGEFLSNNISPTPGTDLRGATATLRSYGSLGMLDLPGGTALEIKMSNATVRGDDGLDGLVDLLYAFCDLGCHFMQLDVVDAELLKKAYEDPEAYGTLVVRVSGWSARFRTMQRQWQKMVVERTEMGY